MIQEAAIQRYRGVRCRCCEQPIPLPAIVVRLEEESQGALGAQMLDDGGRVFTLRCRACEKEHPYSAAEIVDFEGKPRPRVSRAKTASAAGRQPGNFSKVANA